MQIDVIRQTDQLQSLAPEWNALAERYRSPLVTSEWFEACARATASSAGMVIVVVRTNDRICAIAPLISSNQDGMTALALLGGPHCNLSEPGDFLYEDEASLRSLLKAVMSLGQPINLERIPANSKTASVLAERPKGMMVLPLRTTSRSLFVPVEGDWASFEAGMSKSRRTNLKRKTKAANKAGTVTFEAVKPTPSTYLDYLDQLNALEASGWKGRNGTSIYQNQCQRAFWNDYLKVSASRNQFVAFTLKIDDQPIAMRLAVEHANRLWELKIAYDEAFKSCSPGVLLTHETIRYAFEQGLEAHEFLGYEEDWERIWTDEAHDYRSFRIYPVSAAGMLGISSFVARYAGARASNLLSSMTSRHP